MNLRCFISVDVSIKDTIKKLQDRIIVDEGWNMRDVKPVEEQNLHFSIIFLGETTLEAVDILKSSLSGLVFQPFTVTYKGLGVFPSTANARVIWMGTDVEGGIKLAHLAQRVLASIKDSGFTPDKPFIPHVTLFRIKNRKIKAVNTLKYNDQSFGSDYIDKIHLKKSELTRSGPIYSDLFRVYAR